MRVCTRRAIFRLIRATSLRSLLTTLTAVNSFSSNMSASWKTAPTASLFAPGLGRRQLRILLSNLLTAMGKKRTRYLPMRVWHRNSSIADHHTSMTTNRPIVYLHGCNGIRRWGHLCCGEAKNVWRIDKNSTIDCSACPFTVAQSWFGVWWSPTMECHDYEIWWGQADRFQLVWRGRSSQVSFTNMTRNCLAGRC